MKQFFVEHEFGQFPVIEIHWDRYKGHLQQVVSSTKYDREASFEKTYWEVEKFGQDHIIDKDGKIALVCSTNRKFKAKLVL